uniref:DUF4390 domain-containing protein n=1 Tax=Conchiformibius kuhniae TaxID=211502 RepID=A0A8T9MYL1_9NEIS|nr:DUF4390 domain-containing protein [Conchiformibius kuhniae]
MDFDLSYRLEKPRLTAYRYKLAKFVGSDSENNTVRYRLAFQPITKRYRLSADTFSNEYEQLDSALNGIGAIAGWQVLQPGALTDTPVKDIRVKVRLKLSTAQLPKPFQINALTKGNWQLDSDWQRLHIHR